jgi:isoamylase
VVRDVAWFGTDGNELSDQVWSEPWSKTIAVMFNGKTLNQTDEEGEKIVDDSFLILINAADSGVEYALPEAPGKSPWRQVLDTESIDDPFCEATVSAKVILGGRSIRVYSDSVEETGKMANKQRPARTL